MKQYSFKSAYRVASRSAHLAYNKKDWERLIAPIIKKYVHRLIFENTTAAVREYIITTDDPIGLKRELHNGFRRLGRDTHFGLQEVNK